MPERATHSFLVGGMGLWLEAPDRSGPAVDGVLERASAAAVAASAAGIGSVWVSESPGDGGGGPPYEAYSLLGALAVRSGGVHLGVVADGVQRRAPSLLAKIVTGVDVISHGRAVLALDGDCDADAERLSEALTVCRSVLEDDHPTFAGRIYAIDDAVNRPAPVQSGGVPLVVFLHGDGPDRGALVDVAARLADGLVVDGGADGVRAACAAVADRADAGGPRGPVPVWGRLDAGAADRAGGTLDALRAAGASGCLVGLAYPWDPAVVAEVAGLAASW